MLQARPTEISETRPARSISQSWPRVEDARLVTGHGRFVDDVRATDGLHLAFLRSTVAHARLRAVEIAPASTMPDVVAVFGGEDVRSLGSPPVNPLIAGVRVPRFPILAVDAVKAVGEPVAAVVAKTSAAAVAAAERIEVDYAPMAATLDLEAAASTTMFPALPDNRAFRLEIAAGDTDAAFDAAATVVSIRVTHARVAPTSLEPRAVHAAFDDDDQTLTVWLGSQAPHRARRDLAAILGVAADRIRVIAPDVGGAFGLKASLYPEEVLAAWAALTLRRSVKWSATRSEDLLAATHGRGAATEAEAAVDGDGVITALRVRIRAPLGHWLPYSAVVPARNAARILPGPYAVPAVDIAAEGFVTTTAPVGIYRGAGRPEAAALMERLIDAAARATGLDPVELRRRNLISADRMPWGTPTGETLDSGDYHAVLDRACTAADYPGLVATRERRRARGELCGVGVALYVEPCGVGWESGAVRLEADGRFTAATGSSAQGQGRETTFAQIVADALAVAPDRIDVVHGDTASVPDGIGALASRSTAIGGSAMLRAAQEVCDRGRRLAARLLQVPPESLALDQGGFRVRGQDGPAIDWPALAKATRGEPCEPALESSIVFEASGEAWAYGCCIATVSIDADTGVPRVERIVWVDDAGVVVNPRLADDQLVGGLAQGLGQALIERIVYDDNGQLVTGSLMDYAIPRAVDMPEVVLDRIETPSPANPLGAKGVGEAGCIGVPAAILNAAVDALAPLGVRDLDLPLTSEQIWLAITAAKTEDAQR